MGTGITTENTSERINYIAKLWLIVVLIIIPFQKEIMNYTGPLSSFISNSIRFLDEITLIVFLPFAVAGSYKDKIHNKWFLMIFITLGIFSIAALLSGIKNGNSLYVTSYGIFYYVKYFLLIFIYAHFFKSFSDINRIFRVLLITTVIVGGIAFLQEVMALLFRYILEASAYSTAINAVNSIVKNITNDNLLYTIDNWRIGVFRVSSLMSHYNLLGFYSLLILTLYLYTENQIKPFYFFSLLSGIYFSVSRVALAGLIILCILQAVKGRKWMVVFMIIPLCVFLYSFGTSSEFNLSDNKMIAGLTVNDGHQVGFTTTYRQYARKKAMEIWKDYPVWGVGPGMFGGVVAKGVSSPFYEEYNFSPRLLDHFSDLDQFWPQALAETGIIGTMLFFNVYVSLMLVSLMSRKLVQTVEWKNYMTGLSVITVFIFINTFASSLNIVSILYPYCALLGMGIGCISTIEKMNKEIISDH